MATSRATASAQKRRQGKMYEVAALERYNKELFPTLKSLITLEVCPTVSVERVLVTTDDIKALCRCLMKNNTVRNLNLVFGVGNRLEEEAVDAIAQVLERHPSLKKVYLCESDLGTSGASRLAAAFCANRTIQVCDLSDTELGDRSVQTLSLMLKPHRNTVMKQIVLSGVSMSSVGVVTLAKHLYPVPEREWEPPLVSLDLSRNSQIDVTGIQALCEMLKKNRTLRKLSVAHVPLNEESAAALASMLTVNRGLFDLDLDSCALGPEAAQLVCSSLTVNVAPNLRLRKINLAGNLLGDEGASAFGRAARQNGYLGSALLDDNNISDEGAGALAEMLRGNRKIKTLSIRKNRIGDLGMQQLARVLGEDQCRVVELFASENPFTDVSARLLAESALCNTHLALIEVENMSEVSSEGGEALVSTVERRVHLLNLHISGPGLRMVKIRLQEALRRKKGSLARLGFRSRSFMERSVRDLEQLELQVKEESTSQAGAGADALAGAQPSASAAGTPSESDPAPPAAVATAATDTTVAG